MKVDLPLWLHLCRVSVTNPIDYWMGWEYMVDQGGTSILHKGATPPQEEFYEKWKINKPNHMVSPCQHLGVNFVPFVQPILMVFCSFHDHILWGALQSSQQLMACPLHYDS